MPSMPGLSPSRANDFQQCPLLYRLRTIDKLPEPPSRAATLGTLVHAVLERLYDHPAAQRTTALAQALLAPEWDRMVSERAELATLLDGATDTRYFFDDARQRLGTYFTLENPQRLEPSGRELRLESVLADGPALRGVIDRVDTAPDGAVRIIDYKSGKTPGASYGAPAEFQMRFYAMLMERATGTRPTLMRLLYLRDGGVKELAPGEHDIAAVEAQVRDVWARIGSCAAAGDFSPQPSKLCGWCAFQDKCPEFGGMPPALDADAVEATTGVRPASATG